jgi:hypothetical protein
MDESFTPAGTAFAVVSPCSKCKNQSSATGLDGKPFCPRRKWQADLEVLRTLNNGNSDTRLELLTAYGTEGTPQEGDKSLRNPVYLDTSKHTLVWIATLRDNSGVRDDKDNVIAPSILDPSFIPDHTDYIQCRSVPYLPAQHEAAYRTSGGLKEGDTVVAITTQNQQNEAKTSIDINNDSPNSYQLVSIEGIVIKTNLAYNTPRSEIDVDYNIQGT